jgi:hypothetical protein
MNRFARTLYPGVATRNRSRSLDENASRTCQNFPASAVFLEDTAILHSAQEELLRGIRGNRSQFSYPFARGTPGTAGNPLLQVLHKSKYVRVAKFFAALQFRGVFDNRPHFLRQLVVRRSRRKPEPDTNSAQRTLPLPKEQSAA